MPYRDDPMGPDVQIEVAKQRASQLRTELAAVERLVRVLSVASTTAGSSVARERSALAAAVDPAEAWWMKHMNTSAFGTVPKVDETRVTHARVEVAEARAKTAIAMDLAAIAQRRMQQLHERLAAAETEAAKLTSSQVRDEIVVAAVAEACLRDTAELTADVRTAMVAADEAASHAQRDAIRAVLEGADAVRHAEESSFVRAAHHLARTRVQLELVRASLVAWRGPEDAVVIELATIVQELANTGEAPDEAWRRQVASDRVRVLAVIDDVESALA